MTKTIAPADIRRLLAEVGTLTAAAKALGVDPVTIRRRAISDAAFQDAIDAGLADYTEHKFPHGELRGYARGCRCDRCRAANTAKHMSLRAERARRAEDAPHGTPGGYGNWGCRCEECVAANMDAIRKQTEARSARVDEIPHGTRTGYQFWACRCADCTSAFSRHGNAIEKAKNSASLDQAHHHRQQWTGAEMEFLALHPEMTAKDLASQLGRSVFAVRSMRKRVRFDPRKEALAGLTRARL